MKIIVSVVLFLCAFCASAEQFVIVAVHDAEIHYKGAKLKKGDMLPPDLEEPTWKSAKGYVLVKGMDSNIRRTITPSMNREKDRGNGFKSVLQYVFAGTKNCSSRDIDHGSPQELSDCLSQTFWLSSGSDSDRYIIVPTELIQDSCNYFVLISSNDSVRCPNSSPGNLIIGLEDLPVLSEKGKSVLNCSVIYRTPQCDSIITDKLKIIVLP